MPARIGNQPGREHTHAGISLSRLWLDGTTLAGCHPRNAAPTRLPGRHRERSNRVPLQSCVVDVLGPFMDLDVEFLWPEEEGDALSELYETESQVNYLKRTRREATNTIENLDEMFDGCSYLHRPCSSFM